MTLVDQTQRPRRERHGRTTTLAKKKENERDGVDGSLPFASNSNSNSVVFAIHCMAQCDSPANLDQAMV